MSHNPGFATLLTFLSGVTSAVVKMQSAGCVEQCPSSRASGIRIFVLVLRERPSWFNAPCASMICPTGKKTSRAKTCPAVTAKIFCFAIAPNHIYSFRHPGPRRGAYRDRHGRRAGDAMDAVASGAIIARTNDVAAYGEVVWSWRSDAGAKSAKRATRALRVTVATKHGHRGDHV
jgi:hypothetical protein